MKNYGVSYGSVNTV